MHEMRFIDWISILSAIVSVASLIFTIIESGKAKKAAQLAEDAKNSIIDKKSTIDLNKLLEEAKKIEKLLISITAPNFPTSRGQNNNKIHSSIENFLSLINDSLSFGLDEEYRKVLRIEYDFLREAQSADPKPHKEMLEHTRIIIQHTKRIVNIKIFS